MKGMNAGIVADGRCGDYPEVTSVVLDIVG
jgi:hypothetical protein